MLPQNKVKNSNNGRAAGYVGEPHLGDRIDQFERLPIAHSVCASEQT
jgi:hypothetical protein